MRPPQAVLRDRVLERCAAASARHDRTLHDSPQFHDWLVTPHPLPATRRSVEPILLDYLERAERIGQRVGVRVGLEAGGLLAAVIVVVTVIVGVFR